MSKTTREDAHRIHTEKARINQLHASDVGAYGKALGVLPRYLVGGQWKPSTMHGKKPATGGHS